MRAGLLVLGAVCQAGGNHWCRGEGRKWRPGKKDWLTQGSCH